MLQKSAKLRHNSLLQQNSVKFGTNFTRARKKYTPALLVRWNISPSLFNPSLCVHSCVTIFTVWQFIEPNFFKFNFFLFAWRLCKGLSYQHLLQPLYVWESDGVRNNYLSALGSIVGQWAVGSYYEVVNHYGGNWQWDLVRVWFKISFLYTGISCGIDFLIETTLRVLWSYLLERYPSIKQHTVAVYKKGELQWMSFFAI